jgi:hypothetical protein
LIYFKSGIAKANSDVWYNGIATYYIFSIERFQGTSLNTIIAKNSFFVTVSTYFTLFLELFYPVLVWFRRSRLILVIMAASLHLGIYVFMMLHDFELLFIVCQGLWFTNSEFSKLKSIMAFKYRRMSTWINMRFY